jgi:hypothetical protein
MDRIPAARSNRQRLAVFSDYGLWLPQLQAQPQPQPLKWRRLHHLRLVFRVAHKSLGTQSLIYSTANYYDLWTAVEQFPPDSHGDTF